MLEVRVILLANRRIRRSGAAAVELAFVLPFLALLFAAAVDFGRVFYATQTLSSAASKGAQYASGTLWVAATVETNTAAATNAAVSEGARLAPPLASDHVSVDYTAKQVTVTVVYDFPLLTAILIPSGTIRLERSSTMIIAPRPGD